MSIAAQLSRLKARAFDWPVAWPAVEMIGRAEDCRLKAYICPAGVPTIGWGHTEGVKLGMTWTADQADEAFLADLRHFTARVEAMLEVAANPNQLGAMVSLAYNIGLTALRKSTVLRRHNAADHDAAARAFGLWNKARRNGVLTVMRGLTVRRAAEAALYLQPDDDDDRERMPQAVATESSLAASPIARSGALTAGAGVVTGVTSAADSMLASPEAATGWLSSANQMGNQVASFIGLPMPAVLAVVLIGAGFTAMKWRAKQRQEGWA